MPWINISESWNSCFAASIRDLLCVFTHPSNLPSPPLSCLPLGIPSLLTDLHPESLLNIWNLPEHNPTKDIKTKGEK